MSITMSLDEFNSFIGDKFKLFALILSGSIEGDDMDKFIIDAGNWSDYIQEEVYKLEDDVCLYKNMSKLERLKILKKEFDDYTEHIDNAMTLMIENDVLDTFMGDFIFKCLTEFRTLNFEEKHTMCLYASVIQYNNKIDEGKKNLTDEDYLEMCNYNLNYIDMLRKLSRNYIRIQLLSFIVKKLNSQ